MKLQRKSIYSYISYAYVSIKCFEKYFINIYFRTVLSWNVGSAEDINEDSLSLFCVLEPKIDILVIGIGDQQVTPTFSKRIMAFMQTYKINVEILGTESVNINTFIIIHYIQNLYHFFFNSCRHVQHLIF